MVDDVVGLNGKEHDTIDNKLLLGSGHWWRESGLVLVDWGIRSTFATVMSGSENRFEVSARDRSAVGHVGENRVLIMVIAIYYFCDIIVVRWVHIVAVLFDGVHCSVFDLELGSSFLHVRIPVTRDSHVVVFYHLLKLYW